MIIPPFLSTGDKVGLIATAKKLDEKNTLYGIDILKSWGLDVQVGKHAFKAFHQFAGTDDQRAQDLQHMIDDPEIKAIFAARGGYGSTRIIDRIRFDMLLRHPKWICGFSDITAILFQLYKFGVAGFHSPMPSFFHATDKKSLDFMKGCLFGEKKNINTQTHPLNRKGEAKGTLIGGNLSIICHILGTTTEVKTNGNILFIEDVGEELYRIDRMIVQLKRAGLLRDLSGLIVGQFSEIEDDDSFGINVMEIVLAHTNEFDFPLAFDFPVGHTKENLTLPVGMEASLTINDTEVELSC